jgi:hypothetical protein
MEKYIDYDLLFTFPYNIDKNLNDPIGSYQFRDINSFLKFNSLNKKTNIYIGIIGNNDEQKNKLLYKLFENQLKCEIDLNFDKQSILKINFIIIDNNPEFSNGIIILEALYSKEENEYSKKQKKFLSDFIYNNSDIILNFNDKNEDNININKKIFYISNYQIDIINYLNNYYQFKYENKNSFKLYYNEKDNDNPLNKYSINFLNENIYDTAPLNKETNIFEDIKTIKNIFQQEKEIEIYTITNHIYINIVEE